MSPSRLLPLAVVFAAGCAAAAQAPVNAALARLIGSTPAAAAVSFLGGVPALAALALALHGPPPFPRAASAPPRLLAGGPLGAFFVRAMPWSVPRTGALTAFAARLPGQIAATPVLDAAGAPGLPEQAVPPVPTAAPGLVAAGLGLSRL